MPPPILFYVFQYTAPFHETQAFVPHGITEKLKLPEPHMKGDATAVIPEPTEYAFPVVIGAGRLMFFEVI